MDVDPREPPSLQDAFTNGALLFGFDGVLLNQGVIAGIVLLVSLGRILYALCFGAADPFRRQRVSRLLVYVGAAAAVFLFNGMNNRLAARRAETVVAAINAYHDANRAYPGSLNDLVPRFLPRVPKAKCTAGFNTFWYSNGSSSPLFFYVVLPPFGRRGYDFERRAWYSFD